MPHISINNLCVDYNNRRALNSISVAIPDGKITAIIGPSGCGKTTLLKSINRMIELNDGVTVSGSVLIDGQDIYAPQADVLTLRKKLGFLCQRPYPLPASILGNVVYGPRIHRFDAAETAGVARALRGDNDCADGHHSAQTGSLSVERLRLCECCLRLAGLWDEVCTRLHEPASRLSIGQLQRLALARALAVGPEAILADEPTSALDPLSTRVIETQFRALRGRHTVVLVTHILRQAKRLADYVLFMYMGDLIEHGPAEKVFSAPEKPETRAYISGEIS